MKSILTAHATRYPRMEPTDAVKLIYQSEFGGGHLIRDPQKCMDYLLEEYASLVQNPGTPLLEDIGNGFFRVHLAALDAHGIQPRQLGEAFIRFSCAHQGSLDSFREKLSLLTKLTTDGKMPFSAAALQNYLTEYERAGFPPVSHSAAYREAYHPAYRVISKSCLPGQAL